MRARRRRHRQDPGDHPPDRLRRALRRLPAAAGARGHLHRARRRRDAHPAARPRRRRRAGPHLPRRRAAPAALLLAAGGRRRRARAAGAQGRRLVAEAAVAAAAAARPDRRVRDLAAEIEWAKVSLLDAGDYAGAAPPRRAATRPGSTPTAVARLFAGLRGGQDRARRDRLRGRAAAHRRHPRGARGRRRGRSAASTATSSSTSTRTSTRSSSGCSTCGSASRDDLCVVGDASQTIYSFTGASPAPPARLPAPLPAAPQVVRLVRDYRSTPQVVGLANALLARAPGPGRGLPARAASAQRPSRPRRPSSPSYADDPAEAAGVAGAVAALIADGHPGQRDRRPVPHQRPVRGATSRRWPTPGVPYLVRGGERFFDRQEVREAMLLLRGAARGDDGGEPLGRARARRRSAAPGWTPSAPPAGGGAARERWESLHALVGAGRRPGRGGARRPAAPSSSRELDERAAAQHAPTVQGVTLASLHAAKGLEWDAVFLVGLQRRADADLAWPTARRPSRRSAGCSTSAITRARARAAPVVVRLAQPRRPRLAAPVALPRRRGQRARRGRPLRAPGRRGRRAAGAASRRRSPSRRTAAPAAPISTTGRRAQDRPLRRLPAHLRRGARSSALRDVALATVAREAKVPAYVVFTDATLTAIAETHTVRRRARSPRSRASGPPSWHASASRCCRSWVEPTRSRSPKTLLLQRNPRRLTRPDRHGVKLLR